VRFPSIRKPETDFPQQGEFSGELPNQVVLDPGEGCHHRHLKGGRSRLPIDKLKKHTRTSMWAAGGPELAERARARRRLLKDGGLLPQRNSGSIASQLCLDAAQSGDGAMRPREKRAVPAATVAASSNGKFLYVNLEAASAVSVSPWMAAGLRRFSGSNDSRDRFQGSTPQRKSRSIEPAVFSTSKSRSR